MGRIPLLILALAAVSGAPALAQMPALVQGQLQRIGPPRDGQQAAQTGTARIRGRVTGADGAPLRRAQVTVISPEGAVRRMTTTDGNGRYEVAELPAGRYNVTVSKGGYVTMQAGQRRAFEAGTPLTVADGETLANVDVVLARGSVIAGRVTDEFGEPVAMAQVSAQRYRYMPGGERRLETVGVPFIMTDDLGQFRVYGLMPGEYVLSATVRNGGMGMMMASASNEASEGFATTYYPSTTNVSEAQPVIVSLGQETTVQIAMSTARLARVSGVAVNSDGKPLAGATLMMITAEGGGMFSTAGARVEADGTFTINRVAPGDYVLQVAPMPGGATQETGSLPITVAGENLTDVRLTTNRGATLRGRVVFEGTADRNGPFGPPRVMPQPANPGERGPMMMAMRGPDAGLVQEDGSFTLEGLNGEMLLRVNAGPGWTVKQIVVDGQDVTDVPIDFTGARTLDDVRIVLTDKQTELFGSVTDVDGRPVKDYVVVLLPHELREGVSPLRFTRTIRPDQQGAYRTRNLPAGRFVAVAVESLEEGAEWDPEFQKRARDAGQVITIRAEQSNTVDLKLARGL